MQPISMPVFSLPAGQKSISSSPTGSPVTMAMMLDFAVREHIQPAIETYRFSEINEAFEKLHMAKPGTGLF
jgi:uncharacterized zinc-type alcohol dehydrogenase-like protein